MLEACSSPVSQRSFCRHTFARPTLLVEVPISLASIRYRTVYTVL